MTAIAQKAPVGSEDVLLESALQMSVPTLAGISIIDRMAMVRESSVKAIGGPDAGLTEFGAMAKYTIDRADVRDMPGAAVIKALATDLVRQDQRGADLRAKLNAIPLMDAMSDRHAAVAYMIVFDDGSERVGWVLSVYSAAKATYKLVTKATDQMEYTLDNAFTNIMMDLSARYRVKHLHIGPFHRLVRDSSIGARLGSSLAANRTVVHYEGGVVDPASAQWTINCLIADQQYKGTVMGMSKGTYLRALAGKWPKAENQLPALGYRFEASDDPTPVPDAAQARMVRDLIGWASTPELSWEEIAGKLATVHGFASGVQRSRSKETVTIADSRGPGVNVRNLLTTGLPLWLTGSYVFECAVPRAVEVGNLSDSMRDRIGSDEAGSPVIRFVIGFGHEQLAEPWAAEETLRSAIRRLAGQSHKLRGRLRANFPDPAVFDEIVAGLAAPKPAAKGRAAGKGVFKPLAGLAEWTADGLQWQLSARNTSSYLLNCRPEEEAAAANGRRLGWRDADRQIVAVIDPAELHKAIAEAAVDAISTGVSWSRQATAVAPVLDSGPRIAGLVDDIAALRDTIEGYDFQLKVARDLRDGEAMREALSTLAPLRQQLTALEDELAGSQASLPDPRMLDTTARNELGRVAAALAALAKTDGAAPAALARILRDLLHDVRLEVASDQMSVAFSFRVRVMADDGQIILGPITGTVANRRRVTKVHRRDVLIERVFKDGQTYQDAAAALGMTDAPFAKRRLFEQLTADDVIRTKGLRSAVIDCPLPDVRRVMWAEMEARRDGTAFKPPAGVDAAWARHIRETYTGDTTWALSWMVNDPVRARRAVSAVLAVEDPTAGADWEDVLKTATIGLRPGQSRFVVEELMRGKGATRTQEESSYTLHAPVLEWVGASHGRAVGRKVRARTCPFCATQTLTHIVRVPEVPGGILCTTCRRAPTLPKIVFPDGYLVEWVGPRAVGRGKNGGLGSGTQKNNAQ